MNSFFASCEQQERPELRNKPIVVSPVDTDSTCAIAASYPAKKFGIKTGTNIGLAKHLCPGLIVVQARPTLYLQYHNSIYRVLESVLHIEKAMSIDEFACRLPSNESSPERALALAAQLKDNLARKIGRSLTASIGIAPNRFLAKVASDMRKPDGLTLIRPQDLPHILFPLALQDFPGIGPNMFLRLAAHGITTTQELLTLPEQTLIRAFGGILGSQFFQKLRGEDLPDQKIKNHTLSHSHVLPPDMRNDAGAYDVLVRLVHKAAARLRHQDYAAHTLHLALSGLFGKRWDGSLSMGHRQDTQSLLDAMDHLWHRRPPMTARKVGITLFNLTHRRNVTAPLFTADQDRLNLSKAIDTVNDRFGKRTLYFADMHNARAAAPLRLAFNSIPDAEW